VKFALNQEYAEPPRKRIQIPKPTDRKTLVFDLDETLIHCNTDQKKASDVVLHVKFPDGEDMEVHFQILP